MNTNETAPATPRTGTVVSGLILILLGAGIAAIGLGFRLDLQVALIVLLLVGGVGVLLGAFLGARRSERR